MRNLFYNANQQFRNGWWILLFIGLVVVTQPVYKLVKQGFDALAIDKPWFELVPVVLLLLVTWICVFLRKQTLADVGFRMDLGWFKMSLLGTLLGVATLAVTVAPIWLIGGVSFELDSQRSLQGLSYGLYLFLTGALIEEILHRGFIFQRMIDGIGVFWAQILMACVFALAHWGNPGMEGVTQIFASLDLFLASIIFGLAYIKTQSLALPIGLHLGWNWSQGDIFGFSVSGYEKVGWLKPSFHGMEQWLTGGEFGPEASVFSVVVSIITIVILNRWQGTVEKQSSRLSPVGVVATQID